MKTVNQKHPIILPETDDPDGARNLSPQKETIRRDVLVAFDRNENELRQVIDVRWYMGRSSKASVVYCSFWIRGNGRWITGYGKAGGYGYCKQSAAFADALTSAGIETWGHVHGAGDSAIIKAMHDIANVLGYGDVRTIA